MLESESAVAQDFAEQPGGDYNVVPYESNPFPQSEPARLAGLARLFGLDPPAVSGARVLELGCASGGNIIPLAARFPEARFVGVDLSARHVAEGRKRIADLKLINVEVRQGDLTETSFGDERFDYIICHGVYSWIPPAAQDAVLRIAAESLSPSGVAYVSYNVFPGWQMRNVVRDIMLYHAGERGEPRQRIAKARWALEQMAKFSRQDSPYGTMLRSEAKTLVGMNDSYILGEFLAADNAPCYFREFIGRAERHKLTYLCEADLPLCLPENLSPEIGPLIRTMSANKLIPLEQYIDFFIGRTFRQTLLVHASQAANIKRTLTAERVGQLHVSGRIGFSAADSAKDRYVFKDAAGRMLTTSDKLVYEALGRLAAAYPETRTVGELLKEVATSNGPPITQAASRIADAVFKMVVGGLVTLSSEPVRIGRAQADKPKAWPIARADAAAKRRATTNLRHEVAPLDVVSTSLLPDLDGTHDREALKERLLAAVRKGDIRLVDNKSGQPLAEGAALATAAAEHVDLAIQRLADGGLLEAA
jgi:methyltransferase-like protein/2-polyprenyl-3-methyl-5-hydroxy-6-metoxy-1,4-benzoquinol methylase